MFPQTLSLQQNNSDRLRIDSGGDVVIPQKLTVQDVFNITPIAGTAATALTGGEGDIIVVSSTDGGYTSIGAWLYIGAAWVHLG